MAVSTWRVTPVSKDIPEFADTLLEGAISPSDRFGKTQRRRVHAVPQPRRRRPVVEQMPLMAQAAGAAANSDVPDFEVSSGPTDWSENAPTAQQDVEGNNPK